MVDQINSGIITGKMVYNFEDLTVWKEAHKLCLEIYGITVNFPKEETYNLTSQLRRAALSVPTNIAEGQGRRHYLDTVNFLYNARGSIEEVRSLLYTAKELKYINESRHKDINEKYILLLKRLNSFIKSLREKKETG